MGGWTNGGVNRWMNGWVGGWVVTEHFREWVRRKPAGRRNEGKKTEVDRACKITKSLHFLQQYKLSSKTTTTILLI